MTATACARIDGGNIQLLTRTGLDWSHRYKRTIEALRSLKAAGFRLVIITNQSGIGRGYYTIADYDAVQVRLLDVMRSRARRAMAGRGVDPSRTAGARRPGIPRFG